MADDKPITPKPANPRPITPNPGKVQTHDLGSPPDTKTLDRPERR